MTGVALKTPQPARLSKSASAEEFRVYIEQNGELKPIGRIQTKVQISKFRSLLKVWCRLRQKIDINIPGAHSTSRFETLRPNFYAFFRAAATSVKLLQCKITGQEFNQHRGQCVVLFSAKQARMKCSAIGPTPVRDSTTSRRARTCPQRSFSWKVTRGVNPHPASTFAAVYDFGVDRKEEKMPLPEYLDSLPPVTLADRSFLEWAREDCQKIVTDREGKTNIVGSMMNWFKRQYASLDVYWADPPFAKAFARLEMLQKDLKPDQAAKLANLLLSRTTARTT